MSDETDKTDETPEEETGNGTGDDSLVRRRKRYIPVDFIPRRANGESLSSLATHYKASRNTVRAWEEANFDEIEAYRKESLSNAAHGLAALQGDALRVVRGVLTDQPCAACGRPTAPPKERLKAAEIVFDRTGIPKQTKLSGSVKLTSDPASDRMAVLEAAAAILEEEGLVDLADQIRMRV